MVCRRYSDCPKMLWSKSSWGDSFSEPFGAGAITGPLRERSLGAARLTDGLAFGAVDEGMQGAKSVAKSTSRRFEQFLRFPSVP